MNKPAGGILLELDDFPPSTDVLAQLIFRAAGMGSDNIYLNSGRQFCWGFDEALRDCNSYPEEVFQGMLSLGEKRGISFIPVITPANIEDFIYAHPVTSYALGNGKDSPILTLLRRILEGLVEDLHSVFSGSGCTAVVAEPGDGEISDLLFSHPALVSDAARALDHKIMLINRNEAAVFASGLGKTDIFTEKLIIPAFPGGTDYSLPALPGWLSLLDESYSSRIEQFLTLYGETDRILSQMWYHVRCGWEGRNGLNCSENLHNGASRLSELSQLLDDAASGLFSRDWFTFRRRRWFKGVIKAFMHQYADDEKFAGCAASILSILEPIEKADTSNLFRNAYKEEL